MFFRLNLIKKLPLCGVKGPTHILPLLNAHYIILKLKFYKNPYGHTNFFPTLNTDKKQDNIPIDMEVRV